MLRSVTGQPSERLIRVRLTRNEVERSPPEA
jgi:hypothetical protein